MSYTPFTKDDAAFLLVDHQPGVVQMTQSMPLQDLKNNAAMLAKLGEQLDIPVVITTTREDLEFSGTTIEEIQGAAPNAYQARIRRHGSLNAFDDPAFGEAVEATGRRNLIMAGLTTDICLAHSVFTALDRGYRVQVVADASGTTSALADQVTHDRLRSAGAEVTSALGVVFDLFPDLSTPDGQRVEGVLRG